MTSSAALPKRLADLGFTLRNFGGVEAIVPPVCPIPEDGDRQGPTTWFIVGSDPKQDPEANWWEHQGRVWVPYYEIARFPVTVAEYACFVRDGGPMPHD